MTTGGQSVSELLKVGDEEFDTSIKEMSVKNLMAVISGLQREMSREQEAFNSLSGELQKNKGRNSRQYKQISKDMVASQQRLTLLMNRSMKCFAQRVNARDEDGDETSQNSPHGTNTSNGSGDGGLRRRNSAKGLAPNHGAAAPNELSSGPASGPRASSAIYRSKSMHSVAQPSSPSGPAPPSLIAASSSSSASSTAPIRNAKASIPGRPQIMHTSKPISSSNSASTRIPPNSTQPAATARSVGDKPHTPIIMKPSHANGSAAPPVLSNTTHATSSAAAATSTRASTSATLTPQTPAAGSIPSPGTADATTTASSLSNGDQGATNIPNSLGAGTNNSAHPPSVKESDVSSSSENQGGGGIYVKRRFGKPLSNPATAPRPVTVAESKPVSSTSSVSTSSTVPSSQRPFSSYSSSSASSSTPSSSLPPRHPASSRGKPQVVGSTRASYNTNVSPMLLSQPLSKSQGAIHHNHLQEEEEDEERSGKPSVATANRGSDRDEEFRGLPSVRQLAQSFGSMSALNTASSSSSAYARNPRVSRGGGAPSAHSSSLLFSPGKGVMRSSSSVGFLRGSPNSSSSSSSSSPSPASVSTHRLFLTNKGGSNNNNINNKSDKNGTSTITGEIQSQQDQQKLQEPQSQQSSTSNQINGAPRDPVHNHQQDQQQQQQQQQKPRFKQLTPSRGSSSFSVPASAATTSDVENQLALARARLKNRSSREVNLQPSNASNNSTVISPAATSTPPVPAPTDGLAASSSNVERSQSATAAAAASTDSPSNLSPAPGSNSVQATTTLTATSSSAISPPRNIDTASGTRAAAPKKEPASVSLSAPPSTSSPGAASSSSGDATNANNRNGITTTTTTTTIRRSRSRDELEQGPRRQPPLSDRDSLLKQIQARRKYDDDDNTSDAVDGGGSSSSSNTKGDGNFRSMAKLSMSMPSLLQPGKIDVTH